MIYFDTSNNKHSKQLKNNKKQIRNKKACRKSLNLIKIQSNIYQVTKEVSF